MIRGKPLKKAGISAVLAGMVLYTAVAAWAGPGALDTTFSVLPNSTVNALLTLPNDKILAGGVFALIDGALKPGLVRLYPDGTPDSTFTNVFLSGTSVNALAMQSDGKILVGGQLTITGQSARDVARLNVDGSLDTTFSNSFPNNPVSALAVQADGKILMGGAFTTIGTSNHFYIARLNTDGTVDNSFNPGTISGSKVSAIAVQPDGNILIGGTFSTFTTYGVTRANITRLLTNGVPDLNYAATASAGVQSIFLQADGRALVGGSFTTLDSVSRGHFGLLNFDGTINTVFSPTVGVNSTVNAVTEDDDGNIYLAGIFSAFGNTKCAGILRLFDDGALDSTFNSPTNYAEPTFLCMALQDDEKVLLGGNFISFNSSGPTNLVRLYGDNYPAEIVTQPRSTNAVTGSTVTFSVELSNPTEVSYQWFKNGVEIPGAVFEEYTIFNAQMADAGVYSVEASAGFGSTISSNAILQVGLPPSITLSPTNLTVDQGDTASFTAAAAGTNLSYFWNEFVSANEIIVGTNATLTLTNIQPSQAGEYILLVTNIFGRATSAPVTLTVLFPVAIATNPADQTIQVGGSATFSVSATGNPVNYQWLFGSNTIPGATSSSYTVTNASPANAGGYSVIVSNQFNSVTSPAAQLIVTGASPSLSPHLNADRSLTLHFQGTPGTNYVLQATTSMTPPIAWQNVATNAACPDGSCNFTNTSTASPALFYRISSQ